MGQKSISWYVTRSYRHKRCAGAHVFWGATAARIWFKIRSRDTPKSKEDGHCRCDRVRLRLERYQLLFIHQQPTGRFWSPNTACSLAYFTTKQQYSLDHIPTLFVATKSDLDLAMQVRHIGLSPARPYLKISLNSLTQRHEVQPDVYCRRLGLQVPVAVSVKTGQTADVFHSICSIALNP